MWGHSPRSHLPLSGSADLVLGSLEAQLHPTDINITLVVRPQAHMALGGSADPSHWPIQVGLASTAFLHELHVVIISGVHFKAVIWRFDPMVHDGGHADR
jgi:hypothetical protein